MLRYFYKGEEISEEKAQYLEDAFIAHVALGGSGSPPERLGGGEGAWCELKEGGRSECKHCGQVIVLMDGYWKHPEGLDWKNGGYKTYYNRCQRTDNYGTNAEPKI